MTAFIAATGQGDVPTGSIEYKTIFAVGLTLFVHDARDEPLRDPARPPLPGGVRMSAAAGSIRRGRPRGAMGRAHLPRLPGDLAGHRLSHARCAARARLPRRLPWLDDAVLLFEPPSADPAIAGARPAILATIYLAALLLLLAVPIGVGTAIYLEEYANRERWYNRLLEVNIQNLAAVPSIVYGILGLAFLVRGIGLGRVLLAGALILTLLVLPTVIIAAREAIRAVPDSIRQGAYALGSTKWQVVWRQVLPAAIPGIATGSILALSRAIGETAPLILVGALTYVSFDPTILGDFTALPIQIYNWIAPAPGGVPGRSPRRGSSSCS